MHMTQSPFAKEAEERAGEPVISTTDVAGLLGFTVPSHLLESLGVRPVATVRRGVYWRSRDYQLICLALAKHLRQKARDSTLKKGGAA
jgi:hypothetical protein